MRRLAVVVLFLTTGLAGCVSDEPNAATDAGAGAGGRDTDPWAAGDRILLAERSGGDLASELDFQCAFGGGVELTRSRDRIAEGTGSLDVTVKVPATYTGYQVGYSIDGGAVMWLDTVAPGDEAVQSISVEPGQVEIDRQTWRFFMQANVYGADQACYTGGGAGPLRIMVEAVRA